MKCDTTCIHFPCMRAECGLKWECPMYKSAITQAIEIIDRYNKSTDVEEKQHKMVVDDMKVASSADCAELYSKWKSIGTWLFNKKLNEKDKNKE